MKKLICIAVIAGSIATAVSCHKSITAPSGTTTLQLPATADRYYGSMVTQQNPGINEKAALGRALFYDGHLSLNNAISCASCHKQSLGFADNAQFSTGYEGKLTSRNSKGIVNLMGVDSFLGPDFAGNGVQPLFWDGRETIVKNLIARPITNHVEMGMASADVLPAKLAALNIYQPLFNKAYGDEEITADRISECVAAFIISIRSTGTKLDRYMAGDLGALSALELQGKILFETKYQCVNCHHITTPVYFSGGSFDIGLDDPYVDNGVGNVTMDANDRGKFVVPNLRNVALTAPYMHDGRFKTLNDVLDHYSHGIQSTPNLATQFVTGENKAMAMNISGEEKQALIAFLNTLTDYSIISDPKFSNPFKTK